MNLALDLFLGTAVGGALAPAGKGSAARSTSRSRYLVFNSPFRHLAARVAVSGAKASQRSSTLAISSLACPLARRLLLCTQPAEQAVFHCRSKVTSRSVSVVSTTKMASRLAGSVALAFSLMG